MKPTFKPTILFLLLITFIMSCSKEPVSESIAVDSEDVIEDDNNSSVDTSMPCDINLADVPENGTVIIDCVLDLGGATINLSKNVTILYEGGKIINGTINFSDNNVIDGRILNETLTVSGSLPLLKDKEFKFNKKRWGIVEGKVSDEVALENREIINKCINTVWSMGAKVFFIDNIDAFFDVKTETGKPRHDKDATIFIPSNFHFKMGDNCNLRVQPNGSEKYVLLYSKSTDNIIISGGKLWGDRYTHDYNTVSGFTHEWGHIIMFVGVHNGIVDGVEMHEGSGDGMTISGTAHRLNDGSLKPDGRESRNVTVRNCLINDNRRNNISITDGTNLFIEYNTIINAGSGDDSSGVTSNGTSPRAGIDIEAFKNNAPDNNSVYDWQKTENVHIRNNIFEKNFSADFVFYNGEKTFVYENIFRSERAIGAAYAFNNEIYNNTFERPEGLMSGSQAINLEPRYWENGTHRIKDFKIYNNTFTGYQYAIVAGGQGHLFKDNTITECQRGVILIESEDLDFDNNVISSSISNSYGYYSFVSEVSVKNCMIKNGETNTVSRDVYLSSINNVDSGDIMFDNVDFKGPKGVSLNSAQNITIQNSFFNDLKIVDCDPTLVNNN